MTQKEQQQSDDIKSAHDIEGVRAKYAAVLGRDHLGIVLYQAFLKILLKTFSWSAWWAIHGTYTVDDYVRSYQIVGKSGEALQTGEMSWLPFAYAGCAWLNFLLRPQFKRLVEAAAKALENWKS